MKALGMDAKSEEIRKLINDIDSDGEPPPALVMCGRVGIQMGRPRLGRICPPLAARRAPRWGARVLGRRAPRMRAYVCGV
jgi:hypothetical protein